MSESMEPRCELERALNRLGASDGNSAPSGLESRVFEASRRELTAPTGAVVARIGWARVRLAAAVAIVGLTASLAAVLTQRSPGTSPEPTTVASAEASALDAVDAWLSESPLGEREESMDDLFFAIVEFDPRSADDWTLDDLLTTEGDSL